MSTYKICFGAKRSSVKPVMSVAVLEHRRHLTLKLPITTVVSALSSACDFKSFLQTVCLYAKEGLKSLQECSADDINRPHFQMQVFLQFYRLNSVNRKHSA